jgi:hypothetical protein
MGGGELLLLFVLANVVALLGTALFAEVADAVERGRGRRRGRR